MLSFSVSAFADTVRLTLKIEFAKGSIAVEPTYVPQVEAVAKFLEKYPQAHATIEGHSDDIGADDVNQRISQVRANTVRDLLILKFAVDPRRLKAVGYGETKPIADNKTPQGRYKNRRVVASVEAEAGVFKEEAAEIQAAAPTPTPVASPSPTPVPVREETELAPFGRKPVKAARPKEADQKTFFSPRFTVGLLMGPPGGPGLTYAWTPVVWQEAKFKSSLQIGMLHLKNQLAVDTTGFELGWILSPQIAQDVDADVGALLANFNGGITGPVFELYLGVSYQPRLLPFWDRLSFAYVPILVKGANLHAVRFSLGFDF